MQKVRYHFYPHNFTYEKAITTNRFEISVSIFNSPIMEPFSTFTFVTSALSIISNI